MWNLSVKNFGPGLVVYSRTRYRMDRRRKADLVPTDTLSPSPWTRAGGNAMRKLRGCIAISAVSLSFVACDEPAPDTPEVESSTETAERAQSDSVEGELRVVGEFEATWSPESGEFEVRELAFEEWASLEHVGMRDAIQPLYCPVATPSTLSIDTVDGSLGFDPYACGFAEAGEPLTFPYDTLGAFCATIELGNRRDGDYEVVYAQITSVVPESGYNGYRFPYGTGVNPLTIEDADAKPSDTLGLWSFGEIRPVGVDGDTATAQWSFENNGGAFSFRGAVIAAVREVADGLDNDCDGSIDEGIRQYAAGEACEEDLDCVSALCDAGICTASCSPGFFGADCLSECPGGASNACFGNGECFDDAGGDGSCECIAPWGGATCQECDDQHWGANCANTCLGETDTGVCNDRGICNSGISGDGSCACGTGFHGDSCEWSCFDGERNGEEIGVDCGDVCGVECWGNEIKFTAFDVDIRKQFSWSLATSGDVLIAGAVGETSGADNNAGAVYFYDYDGAQYDINERFSPPVSEQDARFGYDVAVSGDLAVVSAPFETVDGYLDGGAVYVYERDATNAWGFTNRLTFPDFDQPGQGRNNMRFGIAVATDGDQLFVGVNNYRCCDISGQNRPNGNGAVYVYSRDGFGGWDNTQVITIDHYTTTAYLGRSIAVDGNRLVLGRWNARTDAIDESRTGDVYLYENDGTGTWIQSQSLAPGGLLDGDRYGSTVTVDGNVIAVSARRRDTPNGTNTGSVYVWRYNGVSWNVQELVEPNGRSTLNWGYRVDIEGDQLFVAGGGRVYVFEHDGAAYQFLAEYGRPPGPAASGFGGRVSVTDEGRVLVGALFNSSLPDRGTVFVYDIEPDASLTFTQRVVPLDVQVGDSFGWVVEMDETRVIAGAFGEDMFDEDANTIRLNAGAAYVFRRDDGVWADEAKLGGLEDFQGGEYFGSAVSIDGDLIAVSAPRRTIRDSLNVNNSRAGIVYLFRYDGVDTWELVASIPSPYVDDTRYRDFGTRVAVSGDNLFVATLYNEQPIPPLDPAVDPPQCSNNGAVNAYRLNPAGTPNAGETEAWEEVVLPNVNADCNSYYGSDIDIEGDRVAIGARGWAPASRGSVFIFDNIAGTWTFTARVFRQTDVQNYELMGRSVALDGDTLVAGAHEFDERANGHTGSLINYGTGRVHIFRFAGGTWNEGPWLNAPGIERNARLGTAVSVEDDIIIAGATGVDGLGFIGGTLQTLIDAGAVYVFRDTGGDNWVIERTIVGSDIDEFDQFGRSVAIVDRRIAVGAVFEAILGADEAGAAYVYE